MPPLTLMPASATAVAIALTIHLPKAFHATIRPYSTSLNSAAFSETKCDDETILLASGILDFSCANQISFRHVRFGCKSGYFAGLSPLPKPPPPGVSMTKTSPTPILRISVAVKVSVVPSVRSTQLRPSAASLPPSMP